MSQSGNISQTVSGLLENEYYRLICYVKTDPNAEGFISFSSGGSKNLISVRDTSSYWVKRELIFQSADSSGMIQFFTNNAETGSLYVDNVFIEHIDSIDYHTVDVLADQESTTASINVEDCGEYVLEIHYQNSGNFIAAKHLYINGVYAEDVYFPKTSLTEIVDDCIRVPVELPQYTSSISFTDSINVASITGIDFYKIGETTIESPELKSTITENTYNYLINGSFQNNLFGWDTWEGNTGSGANCSFTEIAGTTSYLMHYGLSDYEVYNSQTLTGIPNGNYALQAFVKSSGGQVNSYMDAKGFGPGLDQKISIPAFGDNQWVFVEIPGILVQNNSITVGFYSNAHAGNWIKAKNVALIRETNNLVYNGSFELKEPLKSWYVWPGQSGNDNDASYTENDGYLSDVRLTHCKNTPYEVFTGQKINNLANGTYALSAWVKGNGTQKHFLSIKNYGGEELKYYIPNTDTWTYIVINDIPLTSSHCEIGIYSNADSFEWCSADNIIFQKTNTFHESSAKYDANINLISNDEFEADDLPTISNWSIWLGSTGSGDGASFVEQSGYQSDYRLTHYKSTAYEVFNGMVFSDLIAGRYTLSAWVLGDGTETHFISIKNHGFDEVSVAIPTAPYPNWTLIKITDVPIYTGSCEIGYYSNAIAGSWSSIDHVSFYLQE